MSLVGLGFFKLENADVIFPGRKREKKKGGKERENNGKRRKTN
jgi:hypothetical protein